MTGGEASGERASEGWESGHAGFEPRPGCIGNLAGKQSGGPFGSEFVADQIQTGKIG